MGRCRRIGILLALAVGALVIVTPGGASAQRADFMNEMRTGIGYTAVFPDVFAGAGAWHMLGASRFGVFGDVKTTVGSLRDEPGYCPAALSTCTVDWVEQNRNDVYIRDVDEHLIFNAGGMYAIARDFMLMLGGGVSRIREVREYYDEEDEPVTPSGVFYVAHDLEATWEPQVVAGMLMRASSHFVFRFGYESAPGGMSLGLYIVP